LIYWIQLHRQCPLETFVTSQVIEFAFRLCLVTSHKAKNTKTHHACTTILDFKSW